MKQRLKGLLALVLSLTMVFALATNAWAMVSIGYDEVEADKYWKYEQNSANVWTQGDADNYNVYLKNGTLTLNDFTVDIGGGSPAISSDQPLTINLIGSNSVTGSYAGVSGNVNAISVDGALAIEGTGSLTTSGTKSGIESTGDLTISGATVNATGGDNGIIGSCIAITDATVNATGGGNGPGIFAYNDITISGDNANVTATGGDTGDGICAFGNIAISDGTVTAEGDVYGIYSNNAITITGGEVEAKADDDGGVGIRAVNSITISGTNTEVTVGCATGLDATTVNIAGGSTVSIEASSSTPGTGAKANNSNTLNMGGNWYQWSTDNTNFTDSTTTALTKESAAGTATLYIKPAPGGGAPTPPPTYYPIYIPTVEDEPEVTAPNTFDGGIASAVVVTILSATGGAWLAKKKD